MGFISCFIVFVSSVLQALWGQSIELGHRIRENGFSPTVRPNGLAGKALVVHEAAGFNQQPLASNIRYLPEKITADYPLPYLAVVDELNAKELFPFDVVAFQHRVRVKRTYLKQRWGRALLSEIHYSRTGLVEKATVYGLVNRVPVGPKVFRWTYQSVGSGSTTYRVKKAIYGSGVRYVLQQVARTRRPDGTTSVASAVADSVTARRPYGTCALWVANRRGQRLAVTEGITEADHDRIETRKEERGIPASAFYQLRVLYGDVQPVVPAEAEYFPDFPRQCDVGGFVPDIVLKAYTRREEICQGRLTGCVIGEYAHSYFCSPNTRKYEYARLIGVYQTVFRHQLPAFSLVQDLRNEVLVSQVLEFAKAKKLAGRIREAGATRIEYGYTFFQ